MQLGMIGLGRMGTNMVTRLLKAGHDCVVYDRDPASVQALAKEGAIGGGLAGGLYRQAQAAARRPSSLVPATPSSTR